MRWFGPAIGQRWQGGRRDLVRCSALAAALALDGRLSCVVNSLRRYVCMYRICTEYVPLDMPAHMGDSRALAQRVSMVMLFRGSVWLISHVTTPIVVGDLGWRAKKNTSTGMYTVIRTNTPTKGSG